MDIGLGRLRQWAGEVISSREKVSVNEEFKALEKDIEIRKDGINKLILASKIYHHTLSKKKKTTEIFFEEEKLLPIDILGLVMMRHGEQFGGDSTFGDALVKLGSAHCKIATLQEAYALTFSDTFVASMERFRDEIKVYESLRKKLESRKSAADSAASKFEKLQNGKKDKEKVEAEDEMERTKQRYEEIVEDLRANMHAIQENEYNQLHELTALIDIEFNFVQNYLQVLKDVRAEWKDSVLPKQPRLRNRSFSLRSPELTKLSLDDDDAAFPKRAESRHGRRSSNASNNKTPSRPTSRLSRKRANSGAASSIGGSFDEKTGGKDKDKDRTRRMSMAEWASSAMGTVTGGKGKKNKDRDAFAALDEAKTGTTEEPSQAKSSSTFLSIAIFASKSAPTVSHVTEDSAPFNTSLRWSSGKKIAKALYDFDGGSDELSFKAGTEIAVLNEVLDDWWMGEVDGQTGLFPTSYVEVSGLSSAHSDTSVSSVTKPHCASNSRRTSFNGRRPDVPTPKHKPMALTSEKVRDNSYLTSDGDDDDIRDLTRLQPVDTASTSVYGAFDNHSKTFSTDGSEDLHDLKIESWEEAQNQGTFSTSNAQIGIGGDWVKFDNGSDVDRKKQAPSGTQRQESRQVLSQRPATPKQRTLSLLGSLNSSLKIPIVDSAQQPLISRSKSDDPSLLVSVDTTNIENTGVVRNSPLKKVPPPPPPRRLSQLPSVAPPVPLKKGQQAAASSSSSNSSLLAASSNLLHIPDSGDRDGENDQSPFDSVVDLGLPTESEVGEGTCDRFRQNPFKPKGMCSNCLQFHDTLGNSLFHVST